MQFTFAGDVFIPTVLGTVFVAGRLYTRGVITRNWGWDDFCIVIAWFLTVCVAVTNALFCNYGGGRHVELQTPSDLKPFFILAFASRILYQVSLMMVRVAICLVYSRIFQDRLSKIIVYSLLAFQIVSTIPLTLIVVFQCDPIASQWDFSIEQVHCIDTLPGIITFTACSIFSDVALIVFVVPRVLPLKINKRQKATLVAIVSFGVLVIIASIIRFVRSKPIFSEKDYTWDLWEITTWSSIELNTALFCVSAPCLRPLVRKLVPDITWLKSAVTASRSQATSAGGEERARLWNDFRMASRFTVGGSLSSLNNSRPGMGRKERSRGRSREEWEMSVMGSRKGSRAIVDEEDWIGLVDERIEEDERIKDGMQGLSDLVVGLGRRSLRKDISFLGRFKWRNCE
ncbi:integral membrane protein [Botrytis cinerea]